MSAAWEHADCHRVGVIAVIVDDQDRVLLTRRHDNGHWEPPGGGLERDEDLITGLRREVREETGLEVRLRVLAGVYKNMQRTVVTLVFRCAPAGGTLTLNDEVTAFLWATPREVSELCSEAFAARVTDALSYRFLAGPAVRHHDGVRLL
jgi:8-oxo-dGTP diphosphatase